MTKEEFEIEATKGIHSLTKIAHLAAAVNDDDVIKSAGAEYIRKYSGISIDIIETLQKSGVDIIGD